MPNRNDSLGFDMYARMDIDPLGRSSSGQELVVSACIHRVTVGLLPLIDAPNGLGYVEFGDDVRLWCGAKLTEDQLAARAASLGPIIERDPRIREATVTGTLMTAPGSLFEFRIDIDATLRTGETISLVLGVSAVTVELLAQGT